MERRGFTLIELLVVIAIIGMLSSVVLASLNSARDKAKDAAVKSQLVQAKTLFELEYNDTGSYQALKAEASDNGWFNTAAECASQMPSASAYTSQARAICTSIVNATGSTCNGDGACLYFGYESSGSTQKYSVMAWLPGARRFFCAGPSGVGTSVGDPWLETGCHSNP